MATVVGVVSPGAMGSAVGAAYAAGGLAVVTTLEGRSARSSRLAAEASLDVVSTLDELVATADVVLSVVPPGEAAPAAGAIAAAAGRARARPLVADLNAVSPARVREIAAVLAAEGLELVDGSISGPPPRREGGTRLYLSGARAAELGALPAPGLEVRTLGPEIGTASALKMCTASVYKGTVALLAHALLTARAHGVVQEVLDDLDGAFPSLVARAPASLASAAAKSERYVPEMHEIADTQSAAGLTPEVFAGMAAAYEALARTPPARRTPEDVGDPPLEELLDGLAPSAGSGS